MYGSVIYYSYMKIVHLFFNEYLLNITMWHIVHYHIYIYDCVYISLAALRS